MTIANQANTSSVIPVLEARSAIIALSSTLTSSSLTFLGSTAIDGTFTTIENGSGAALSANVLSATTAAILVPIPTAALTVPYLKIKTSSLEGASRSFTVVVKS